MSISQNTQMQINALVKKMVWKLVYKSKTNASQLISVNYPNFAKASFATSAKLTINQSYVAQ